MTPPPTIRGVATNAPTSPAHTPVSLSTPRGTPVRTLRMSPSQKGITPPKKGENELPSPMSLDEVTERLNLLGVLPYIDQWRDALRQWFSEFLLNPLVYKINSSHLQVCSTCVLCSSLDLAHYDLCFFAICGPYWVNNNYNTVGFPRFFGSQNYAECCFSWCNLLRILGRGSASHSTSVTLFISFWRLWRQ